MTRFTRRYFLKAASFFTANACLSSHYTEAIAAGLEKIFERKQQILWLQGLSCSGCSVSFLNAENPGPLEILTNFISLVFHSTVSATQGHDVHNVIEKLTGKGNYTLVVEGAIPVGIPEACVIGKHPIADVLPPIIKKADSIIAVGTCGSYGGIPAAEGNLTGAVGVKEFMEKKRIPIEKRLINCPGCPVHPQSIVGTIAYAVGRGYPPVNETLLTPDMFYAISTHDECPRFHSWEREIFAEHFGDPEGCLFKLGCLGPHSFTDCPRRQWNGGVNWCIRASAPCIACTSPLFAKSKSFPFYRKGEKYHDVTYNDSDRGGDKS